MTDLIHEIQANSLLLMGAAILTGCLGLLILTPLTTTTILLEFIGPIFVKWAMMHSEMVGKARSMDEIQW